MVDDPGRAGRTARLIEDADEAIVLDGGVGDGKADAARRRLNENAVARGIAAAAIDKILQGAVGDGQAAGRIENNAIVAGSGAVDLQPDQRNVVAGPGSDGDAVAGSRR